MKVLITGASGFVGKHLLKRAAEYFGTANVAAFTSKNIPGYSCILYTDYGLRNLDADVFSDVDILIHAGAYTPKSALEANNIVSCNSNIYYTERLLGFSFEKLKKIIYLSSLDIYEPSGFTSEHTAVNPRTLYGMSKLYSERMLEAYGRERNVAVQILRVGHVYGPGEEGYQKVLPVTINNILLGRPVCIWGDGNELRSFIYIDDVIEAVINSIEFAANVGPINVVSGLSISIKDLVDKLVAISTKSIEVKHQSASVPAIDYVFDNTLLKKTLLEKETDFECGLRAEYTYAKGLLEIGAVG